MTHFKTSIIACLLAVGLVACAEDTATETLMGMATDLESRGPAASVADPGADSFVADPAAPGTSARVFCDMVCDSDGENCEAMCCGFGMCCTSSSCTY